MSDPWFEVDNPIGESGMTEEEGQLATRVYEAIQRKTNFSDRSMQSKASIIGVSELGVCQERTRLMLAGVPEPEGDKLAAFLGTAIGDHIEDAILDAWQGGGAVALRHQLVTVKLRGDGGEYELHGHPDIVLPDWGVIDVKTVDGLEVVRRQGPSRQQRFQRELYCKGAAEGGLLSIPLEQAKTANVWLDRSGRTKELFVNITPYSEEVVREATMWLDEVVYNYRLGQPAMKEPPRNWCEAVCGHFQNCRQYDSDVSGLILDDEVMTAVVVYDEGRKLEQIGKRKKDDAKAILDGLDGYVQTELGRFQIRTSQVNGSTYSVTRKPGTKLEVRKMKD